MILCWVDGFGEFLKDFFEGGFCLWMSIGLVRLLISDGVGLGWFVFVILLGLGW